MKMNAILLPEFGSADNLVFGETDKPVPGEGQILIRVRATSVNRPDVIQRQGNYAPPPGDSEILGLEVAGDVEELGAGVSQWHVGDRVFALLNPLEVSQLPPSPIAQTRPLSDGFPCRAGPRVERRRYHRMAAFSGHFALPYSPTG